MSHAEGELSRRFTQGECNYYVLHLRKIRIDYVICCNLNLCVFLEKRNGNTTK